MEGMRGTLTAHVSNDPRIPTSILDEDDADADQCSPPVLLRETLHERSFLLFILALPSKCVVDLSHVPINIIARVVQTHDVLSRFLVLTVSD